MEKQRQEQTDRDIQETDRECLCSVRMVLELYETAVTASLTVKQCHVSLTPSLSEFYKITCLPFLFMLNVNDFNFEG